MQRIISVLNHVIISAVLLTSCSTGTSEQGNSVVSNENESTAPNSNESGVDNGNGEDAENENGADTADVAQGELYVDLYDPTKTCEGTTLLPDLHDQERPRIIEVDMQGQIVWEYVIPDELKRYHNPGLDVELLSDNSVLFVLPGNGVYEVDREGNVVWSYLDTQISHDADRLANGNTLFVSGNADRVDDPQVKEVNSDGEIVWSWYASDQFYVEPYIGLNREGWTHANAVTRLDNGNTLVSLRNFNLTVEVTPEGVVAWSLDWSTLGGDDPHEPEVQSDGNLLICLQHETPHQAVEINRATGEVEWQYYQTGLRTARDCDRLPNGNTLIQAVLRDGDDSIVFEVTPDGEIVWQLKIMDSPAEGSPGWFYKAERICEE